MVGAGANSSSPLTVHDLDPLPRSALDGRSFRSVVLGIIVSLPLHAATYENPPEAMRQVIEAPALPSARVSPDGRWILLVERDTQPAIAELASPAVQLARFNIDTKTNNYLGSPEQRGRSIYVVNSADGSRRKVVTPESRLGMPRWAPDSQSFMFEHVASDGVELWIGTPQGAARRVTPATLNGLHIPGAPCVWLSDSRTILCQFIPETRGTSPSSPDDTFDPIVQESGGAASALRQFSGALRKKHEQAQFEFFVTSQPHLIDITTGEIRSIAEPGVYESFTPSPSGTYFLSVRLTKPFLPRLTADRYGKQVVVLDRRGKFVRQIANIAPNYSKRADEGGAAAGDRRHAWIPSLAHTLTYIQSLDGGDPEANVPNRDRIMVWAAPFRASPVEILRTHARMIAYPSTTAWGPAGGIGWLPGGSAWVEEIDWSVRRKRVWLVTKQSGHWRTTHKMLFDFSIDQPQQDPGVPLLQDYVAGQRVVIGTSAPRIVANDACIYLAGEMVIHNEARPFVDCLEPSTKRKRRVFQSEPGRYERLVAFVGSAEQDQLIHTESPQDPENFRLRRSERSLVLTSRENVIPDLAEVEVRRLHYKRRDGLKLSGDLYLPATYHPGKRIPVLIWAYPLTVGTDVDVVSARSTSNRYRWAEDGPGFNLAIRLLVTQGYGVLWYPSMPLVGGRQSEDTYIMQLIDDAEAAKDAIVDAGVADPAAVAIGGHSFGAFMVANLLARTDLFAAGIAMSGGYNLTNSPFGFQDEGRTLWQAPQRYLNASAFLVADQISEPLLLIHGTKDDSVTTSPYETWRMFDALDGLGKTSRIVMLPHEGHTYLARESTLHIAYEMSSWLQRFLLPNTHDPKERVSRIPFDSSVAPE